MRTRHPAPCRKAFTLLELIIVVAIIIALMGVLLVSVRGALTTAKAAATYTTIQKINNELKQRRRALDDYIHTLILRDQFLKYELDTDTDTQTSWRSRANYNEDLATILAMKNRVRQYFPQQYLDVAKESDSDGNGSPDWIEYGTVTDPVGGNGTESAEVLYYMITGEPIPGSGTPLISIKIPGYMPSGPDLFTTSEVADTDADGRLEVVDGWGKPLRFYRWPTRLIRPNYTWVKDQPPPPITAVTQEAKAVSRALPSITDLNRDPDDPLAWTQQSGWSQSSGFEAAFHTPGTYHTFLILSPGPDNVPGLGEPYDNGTTHGRLGKVSNLDALYDDITNLNSRAGG